MTKTDTRKQCDYQTAAGERCSRKHSIRFHDGHGVEHRLCWQHGKDEAAMLRAMVP